MNKTAETLTKNKETIFVQLIVELWHSHPVRLNTLFVLLFYVSAVLETTIWLNVAWTQRCNYVYQLSKLTTTSAT